MWKYMKNNILVVAAHPDDEILGVGGTILKHINNNDTVSILILGDGETSRGVNINIRKREEQAEKVAQAFRVENIFLEKFPDNKFDSVPLLQIIKKVEEIIYQIKPNIIYTHCQNDLNIDHQLTFRAVLTVCRPQPDFFVKKILTFETLSSSEWQIKDQSHIFCPTEYVDIVEFIDKKLKILKNYDGELREYPHPRSIEGVKILAQYRGMEIGCKFAEAFQIIRSIKN